MSAAGNRSNGLDWANGKPHDCGVMVMKSGFDYDMQIIGNPVKQPLAGS